MATKAKRAAKNTGRAIAPARPRARRTAAPKPAVRPPARPQLAGLVRRAVLEQLEPRLLLSADLNPLANDALFAAPSTLAAEFRSLTDVGTPSVVISAAAAPAQRASELVFVDTATPDYQRLVTDMRATAQSEGRSLEFVMIDSRRDGVSAISETLAKRSGLEAVHIISHAQDGAVQLGSTELDFETLVERAAQIKKWGDALTANGDILFYGCDLAATTQGQSLIDAIARLTGADVAASENPTGASAKGGDWALEFKTGAIEVHALAGASDWNHTLLTVTVGNNADSVNGITTSIAALIATPGGDGISLREAILAANNTPGTDTIAFNISGGGVRTINVGSTLLVTDSVIIDGRTQGGGGYTGPPLIELNGSGTGPNVDGLVFSAGTASEVHGLIINRFGTGGTYGQGGSGIVVNANARVVIQGNYIGTDASGNGDAGNDDWGIRLKSSGNTIGGTTAADRNVISGNGIDGIYIDGLSSTLTGNVIQGNYIGTNAAGSAAIGNDETGIWVLNSNGNTIGGVAADAGNLISGNGFGSNPVLQGVLVQNSDGNLIQGNRIGTNAAGNGPLPNAAAGIEINSTSDNNLVIGNLISGNGQDGIVIWNGTGNILRANTIGMNLAGAGSRRDPQRGLRRLDHRRGEQHRRRRVDRGREPDLGQWPRGG